MFSAVSIASYIVGAWQFCVASGRLHTDGTQEENVMSSLQTKGAIYLTKTPFQLHNILMSLHVESDSCDRSGVGIFSCKKSS